MMGLRNLDVSYIHRVWLKTPYENMIFNCIKINQPLKSTTQNKIMPINISTINLCLGLKNKKMLIKNLLEEKCMPTLTSSDNTLHQQSSHSNTTHQRRELEATKDGKIKKKKQQKRYYDGRLLIDQPT